MNTFSPSEQATRNILKNARNVVVLTGAGVSTNSGIPDFQTMDELWPFKVSRQEATSIMYFRNKPKDFWEAFRYMFTLKSSVVPNDFHKAIANLETAERNVTVVTQNIDGLHTEAGSSTVLEVHGNLREAFCSRPSCPERVLLKDVEDQATPRCEKCGKFLRPDVTLFGEVPRGFGRAKKKTIEANLLIVAGASLEVGPVNMLPLEREWRKPNGPSVWVNRFMPPYGYKFTHSIQGDLASTTKVFEAI